MQTDQKEQAFTLQCRVAVFHTSMLERATCPRLQSDMTILSSCILLGVQGRLHFTVHPTIYLILDKFLFCAL